MVNTWCCSTFYFISSIFCVEFLFLLSTFGKFVLVFYFYLFQSKSRPIIHLRQFPVLKHIYGTWNWCDAQNPLVDYCIYNCLLVTGLSDSQCSWIKVLFQFSIQEAECPNPGGFFFGMGKLSRARAVTHHVSNWLPFNSKTHGNIVLKLPPQFCILTAVSASLRPIITPIKNRLLWARKNWFPTASQLLFTAFSKSVARLLLPADHFQDVKK